MATPERSCIACRKKGGKGELIKLADTPSGVVIDYLEKLPGRGAYICAEDACMEKGLKEGPLSRAFKHKVSPPDADAFREELRGKILRKIEGIFGIAMKSRQAVWGFDAVASAARRARGGLLIVAEDISEGTERKFMGSAPGSSYDTVHYSTKDGLGSILGASPVALVFIAEPALAAALGREIGRLKGISRG
ncbi:MAG: DUF448 domain-containing protein [Nitrospirae bacterium]|nr:DUF448 domain-containing protein [Nitrospirota bacterium]